MMDAKFAGKSITTQYSILGQTDLDHMTDTPTRRAHHRRAQSETFFRFPDFDEDCDGDMLLNDVVGDFNIDFPSAPSLSSSSSDTHMQQPLKAPAQLRRLGDESKPMTDLSHFRSLSVDADFFADLDFGSDSRSRYNSSMDGYEPVDSSKKAMAPDKLAELALIDPKRAKRILANRQSAARSKERKTRYTYELEKKVQTLQTEATTLSAEVTKLQRDTTGLTVENKELKLRLQAFEQQAHLKDALNETLREELQRLKIAAGQMQSTNGNNRGLCQTQTYNNYSVPRPQFPPQPQQQNPSQPSCVGFNQRV